MAQVTVTIGGRGYLVACDPGQEERLQELAQYVDGKVEGFARQFAQAGEARLLVMAALVLADELAEANEALSRRGRSGIANDRSLPDGEMAQGIERLAARIEAVAARLETPHI